MKIELKIPNYHRQTVTHTHAEWFPKLLVGAKKIFPFRKWRRISELEKQNSYWQKKFHLKDKSFFYETTYYETLDTCLLFSIVDTLYYLCPVHQMVRITTMWRRVICDLFLSLSRDQTLRELTLPHFVNCWPSVSGDLCKNIIVQLPKNNNKNADLGWEYSISRTCLGWHLTNTQL